MSIPPVTLDRAAALTGGNTDAADRKTREHVRYGLDAVLRGLAAQQLPFHLVLGASRSVRARPSRRSASRSFGRGIHTADAAPDRNVGNRGDAGASRLTR